MIDIESVSPGNKFINWKPVTYDAESFYEKLSQIFTIALCEKWVIKTKLRLIKITESVN